MRARLLALAFAFGACARPTPPAEGEVVLQLEAEPPHLNPLLAGDALSVRVTLGDVYEPLVEMTPGRPLALEPVLARSFTKSDDGRDWEMLRAEVMDQYIDLAIAQWRSTTSQPSSTGIEKGYEK